MIENKNDASRNLEKALQALEQAKQRVANEKKKQNEKKRKAGNHHKYIMCAPRGLLRRALPVLRQPWVMSRNRQLLYAFYCRTK